MAVAISAVRGIYILYTDLRLGFLMLHQYYSDSSTILLSVLVLVNTIVLSARIQVEWRLTERITEIGILHPSRWMQGL